MAWVGATPDDQATLDAHAQALADALNGGDADAAAAETLYQKQRDYEEGDTSKSLA